MSGDGASRLALEKVVGERFEQATAIHAPEQEGALAAAEFTIVERKAVFVDARGGWRGDQVVGKAQGRDQLVLPTVERVGTGRALRIDEKHGCVCRR